MDDDGRRRASPDMFCAGEPTGIGGVDLSLVEGEIAGTAAAGAPMPARWSPRRANAATLGASCSRRRLHSARSSRPSRMPDTIVCRCEDVRFGDLNPEWTSRQAKLYTRAGMGPCQGRICGAALEFSGLAADSVRPPIQPTQVAAHARDRTLQPSTYATRSISTMEQLDWQGVFPAITTPFVDGFAVDHARSAKHVRWLADKGCRGIVALGSLGEAQTLRVRREDQHSRNVPQRARRPRAARRRNRRAEHRWSASHWRKRAAAAGCDGLMVLPPYVYNGDWRENEGALRRGHRRDDRSRACCTTIRSPTAPTSRRRRCVELSRAREPARGEGIERRRASRHGDPRGESATGSSSSPAWTT